MPDTPPTPPELVGIEIPDDVFEVVPEDTFEVGARPLTLASDAFDKPRRFLLHRHADPSGLTGVGAVAWGTVYPDGWVSVCWQTAQRVRSWYETIEDVLHLHGAATSLEWLDV